MAEGKTALLLQPHGLCPVSRIYTTLIICICVAMLVSNSLTYSAKVVLDKQKLSRGDNVDFVMLFLIVR